MSKFEPKFSGPVEGWVVNFVSKNYWRVSRTMPRDDLMQEAYVVFLKVKRAYPDLDSPSHFMALFKTSWTREFTDFANADTKERGTYSENNVSHDGEVMVIDRVGDLENEGVLATSLRQAPKEVLMVLNLFLSAPQEILELALHSWKAENKGNRYGCLLYTSPSPRDRQKSRMPSSA